MLRLITALFLLAPFVVGEDAAPPIMVAASVQTERQEAQAAADKLIGLAFRADLTTVTYAAKAKACKAKIPELEADPVRVSGGGRHPQTLAMIAALKVEVTRLEGLVREQQKLAKDNRADAARILDTAQIAHEPLTPFMFPPLADRDAGNPVTFDPQKDIPKQVADCLASAIEDEKQWLALHSECEGIRICPGHGITPEPDFGPAWRFGTPESQAQLARVKNLEGRMNILAKQAGEKRKAIKAYHAGGVQE